MSDYLFWENFTQDVLRTVAGSFVDFSAKLSNSNAGGGVAVRRHVDLPYLSLSTLAAGQSEPRSTAPANYAKAAKQLIAVKLGKLESYGVKTPEMAARLEALSIAQIDETGSISLARKMKIEAIVRAEFSRIPVPEESIEIYHQSIKFASENPAIEPCLDRRLKQLIVFDADIAKDVVVTPLRSVALPELISAAESRRAAVLGDLTDDEYESIRFAKAPAAKKVTDKLKDGGRKNVKLHRNLFARCDLPMGGSNPQNIGVGKGSSIRSPLLVEMPSIDSNLSKQFAIHHKGISPVNHAIATKLLVALHKEKISGYGVDSRFKEKLRRLAADIVSEMNYRAGVTLRQLRDHAEDVNGNKDCEDEDLFDAAILDDKMQAGIFFNKHRDNTWRKAYADCVIVYLASSKFKPDSVSAPIRSGFSDEEASIVRSTIEQELM